MATNKFEDVASETPAPCIASETPHAHSSPHASASPTAPAPASATATATIATAAAAAAAAASSSSSTTTTTTSTVIQPNSDSTVILVPSHSRWFSWNHVHECEVRSLPEFFDLASNNPRARVYKYYRNSIVKQFRDNPSRKLTFTDVRKTLVGDVGSIRRVFDFLDAWGLINYQQQDSSLRKTFKWEDKPSLNPAPSNSIQSSPTPEPSKRICTACKVLCSIACFACDKYDLTLCARCYVRGNYRVGVSSTDFRRVEIIEEAKTDWTDKDTLHLLEAIMHYGDDWTRVARHVGGRNENECVAHFIKLPFGEEFLHRQDSGVNNDRSTQEDAECRLQSSGYQRNRMCLTPLADASNPIIAQAAFLAALAGVEAAQSAAQAAVTTLSEVDKATRINFQSLPRNRMLQGGVINTLAQYYNVVNSPIVGFFDADITSNGGTIDEVEGAQQHARTQLEKEASNVEEAVSGIIEVQVKNIQDKLVHFEDLDMHRDKEWQQLEQIKNAVFVDQLTLSFNSQSAPKTGERT